MIQLCRGPEGQDLYLFYSQSDSMLIRLSSARASSGLEGEGMEFKFLFHSSRAFVSQEK